MNSIEAAAWAQAAAGLLTFGAALVAVRATYSAPKRAAEFAESLRADSQRADEDRRLKLWVFTSLMQGRRSLVNYNTVGALNLIDVVFRDHRDIRNAWQSFMRAAEEKPADSQKIVERYNSILEAMARALGLSDAISVSDIQTAYYPTGLGTLDAAAHVEALDKLDRLSPASLQ